MCSLLLPLIVAVFLVPIYEQMHSKTDRLTYLKADWTEMGPLVDLRVMPAPPVEERTLLPIQVKSLLKDECEVKFGSGYFTLEPATWQGMAMGCNCTEQTQFQNYYEGGCTYFLTLQGCD